MLFYELSARDLSPRIVSALAGWPDTFTVGNYWFWIPWVLPHLGGLAGAGLYKLMIELPHPPDTVDTLPL